MVGTEESVTKEVNVKNDNHVMHVTVGVEPVASLELCSHEVKAKKKIWRAMHLIYSVYNVDLQEIVDEH